MTPVKVDRNQCYFPTTETVDWKKLSKALDKFFKLKPIRGGGLTIAGVMPDAPKPFRLVEFPLVDIAATMGWRGPIATEKKRELVATYTACLALRFDDLDEVLFETNCLIQAQATIQKHTRGPILLGWNRDVIPMS